MQLDESSVTGETDTIAKDPINDPWICSGCTVAQGNGVFLVTSVGLNSFWGQIYSNLNVERKPTPLQESLAGIFLCVNFSPGQKYRAFWYGNCSYSFYY